MTEAEANKVLEKDERVAEGTKYYYFNDAQTRLVEFHVGDSVEFPKRLNCFPF